MFGNINSNTYCINKNTLQMYESTNFNIIHCETKTFMKVTRAKNTGLTA